MKSTSSSYEHTNRNQLNRSSSKQIYAFAHEPRFRIKTQNLTSRSDYVNFPGIAQSASRKGISFSKSKKALIFQNQLEQRTHPPPNIYQTDGVINHRVGFSLGQKLRNNASSREFTPGPAQYNKKLIESQSSVSFSKQKRKLKFPMSKGQDSPGPYLIELNKIQKILSKYKSTRAIKITQRSKIKNFTTAANPETIIKNKHKFKKLQNSKIRTLSIEENSRKSLANSRSSIVFEKAQKKSYFDVNTKEKRPGPANYESFTEFAKLNKQALQNKATYHLKRPKLKFQKKQIINPFNSIKHKKAI